MVYFFYKRFWFLTIIRQLLKYLFYFTSRFSSKQ